MWTWTAVVPKSAVYIWASLQNYRVVWECNSVANFYHSVCKSITHINDFPEAAWLGFVLFLLRWPGRLYLLGGQLS